MIRAKLFSDIRSVLLLFLLVFLLSSCQSVDESTIEVEEAPEPNITIVAMGDSLTAGLGVSDADAYPAQLERALLEQGHDVRIINAGISGETSSAALSRTPWVLALEPDILLLGTGANDGLRGIDPALTQENIDEILTLLAEKNVTVVLLGMQIVQNLGKQYTQEFKDMYPALAAKHDVTLVPFFLEGVAGVRELNQDDGIHPTVQGYEKIVAHILPYVEQALEELG